MMLLLSHLILIATVLLFTWLFISHSPLILLTQFYLLTSLKDVHHKGTNEESVQAWLQFTNQSICYIKEAPHVVFQF